MKKITITNAYTWYNKGDAGILLGIVETLKKIYNNDVEIDVLSFTPDDDKIRYCKDLDCLLDGKQYFVKWNELTYKIYKADFGRDYKKYIYLKSVLK